MRTDFDSWHLGRQFAAFPQLNQTFIECDPAALTRVFAAEDEPMMMVTFGNVIKAIRPMPIMSNPGYIDH